MTDFLLGLLLSMTLTLLFTPLVLRVARRRRVGARINGHSIHKGFIPKLGGIATFVGWAATVVLLKPGGLTTPAAGLILGAGIMLLLGVVDDLHELSYGPKLLGQVLAAALAVSMGLVVRTVPLPGGQVVSLGQWGVPLTMFWLIGMSNALNLLDGVDGLAAGTTAIAGIFFWLLGGDAVTAAALAGACLAFLRYNFHPARMFLGDSGSLVLGFILGGLAVQGGFSSTQALPFVAPLLALILPLTDTGLAVVRRAARRQHPFHADRDHIHHRALATFGNRQPRTVFCLYGLSVLGGGGALGLQGLPTQAVGLALAALALSGPALVMWLCGRRSRRRKPASPAWTVVPVQSVREVTGPIGDPLPQVRVVAPQQQAAYRARGEANSL